MMTRTQALTAATASGVVALALGGFTLSFASLRDLAISSGVPEQLAFIWPLIVDGFIVVATAAAYELKGRRSVSWYPWSALIVFSAISVTGNALHATDPTRDLTVPIAVASAVSSVPAIALLVASHLLVVMASASTAERHRPADDDASPPAAVETSRARETPQVPVEYDAVVVAAETVAASTSNELVPTTPVPVSSPAPTGAGQLLVGRLEAVVAEGKPITGALIGELLGVSARTGRRRMDELRLTHPSLFTTAEKDPTA